MSKIKHSAYRLLRWSEKYTKTDMVYLASGGFWLTFGQVISAALAFLLSIAFANLLTKETFGMYKYILAVSAVLSTLSLTGLRTAIIQSVSLGYEGILNKSIKINLKWSILIPIISTIISIYYFINGNLNLSTAFLLSGVLTPLINTYGFYSAFLNGKKLFYIASKYQIIRNIFTSLIVFITIFYSDSIILLISSYFLSHAIISFILYKYTVNQFAPNNQIKTTSITYGKHISAMSIFGQITMQIDNILTFHYIGSAQLAIYAFAVAIPNQISGIIKNIHPLALPKFAQANINEIKQHIYQKTLHIFFISLIVTGLYILFAPYIFYTIFPQYIDSINLSRLFALNITVGSLGILPATILDAKSEIKKRYTLSITGSITRTIFLIIFFFMFGIYGLAFGYLLSNLITTIIGFYLVKKIRSDI